MSRTSNLFLTLYNLIRVWDENLANYYLSITTDEDGEFYPELVTMAVIYEMECSLDNCVN